MSSKKSGKRDPASVVPGARPIVSVARFEPAETPFEFPLLPRPFTRLKKRRASGRLLLRAQRVLRTRRHALVEMIGRPPQTRACEKTMLEARAHHLLQVRVAKSIRFDGSHVFMREVDARHSFIVGRERHGHAKSPVDG